MATVTIEFEFTNGIAVDTEVADFDADGLLIAAITEFADDRIAELNAKQAEEEECTDEWECTSWKVSDFDKDYDDQWGPNDFSDLDAWGEYCEECDKHGNAYCMRYGDIGEHDFDDEYNGCHASFEDYAEQFFDDCMECPDSLRCYIDYGRFAADLEQDYSTYEDSEGVHVFRNC